MEFVSNDEVNGVLDDYGIVDVLEGEDRIYLEMDGGEGAVHLHLACPGCTATPREGAKVLAIPKDRLAATVHNIIMRLHLSQLVLIPVGKWRKVFDAVAFSLAGNEDWQQFDATATVELNTRDPLLCEPADFHVLEALVTSLINDTDQPDQGLNIISTSSPVLVELVPDGAVRLSLGSQVLADEVEPALAGSM